MYSNYPDFNLSVIFPIIRNSTILHILPFCHSNGTPKCLKYNKTVSLLVCLSTVSLMVYFCQVGDELENDSSKIVGFLTNIKGLLVIVSNLHAFTTGIFLNPGKYTRLLMLTKKCFDKLNKTQASNSKGLFLILLYNILVIGSKGYCVGVWIVNKKQSRPVNQFIFENIISYFFYIGILFLWGFIYFILGCVKAFKFELTMCMEGCKLKVRAKEICANFLGICEIVELFNDLFGLQIFITIIFIIVDLLICLDLFITFGLQKLNTEFVVLFWTCVLIVLGIIVAHYSEKVKQQMDSVTSICYECVYRFRGEIGDEFSSLAEQIANRNPAISAGGFFNVDHAMLFTLSNLIVSYLVVVVQLSSTL